MNDGSAFVLFMIFREYSKSEYGTSITSMIALFGLFAGFVTCYILSQIFNDAEVEISVCLACVYLFSFIGEYSFAYLFSNDLGVSGVLVVVAMGLYVSKNREVVSPHVEEAMHHFWEMAGFIANTLLFFITGQVIVYQIITTNAEDSATFSWLTDFPIALILYIFCHITRLMCIWFMYPVLKNTGYGCTQEEVYVMVYGGLRGAIGLAMGLIVADDTEFNQRARDLVLFHVSLFVIATLVINASTISYLVSYTELNKPPGNTSALFKSATEKLMHKAHDRLGKMKLDRHYTGADWKMVTAMQPDYKTLYEELYSTKSGGSVKFDQEVNEDKGELKWSEKDDPELIITMIALLQKQERDKKQRDAA